MKKALCLFIFLLILLGRNNANSQSLSVFNCDASKFPIVKANFFAFDSLGNQITNLTPSDFTVTENNQPRIVTNVMCPEPKPVQPVSIVMSIDISGSMRSMQEWPIELSKTTAREMCNSLSIPPSEIALLTYDKKPRLVQDFISQKPRILNLIDLIISNNNGNDFADQLINKYTGLVYFAKSGKYKRVAILLTAANGPPLLDTELNLAKDVCAKNNIIFFAIIYTPKYFHNKDLVQSLNLLAESTGGFVYEGIINSMMAKEVAYKILMQILNNEPCKIEWQSGINCSSSLVNVEVNLKQLDMTAKSTYQSQNSTVASLEFIPPTVKYSNAIPGIENFKTIKVTAINSDFNVTNITSSNPAYTLQPTNFILPSGQTKDLTLSFIPPDSGYSNTLFTFENDLCPISYTAYGGFPGKKPIERTLKLTHPNGGEIFGIGADTIITWEGIAQSDTVALKFSFDNGNIWRPITNTATNYKYIWKNIPPPESNNCLIRVSHITDTVKTTDELGSLKHSFVCHYSIHYTAGNANIEVAWSPDSKQIAVPDSHLTVSIWDIATETKLATLRGHSAGITHVTWSPDGRFVATTSDDITTKIWDAKTGKEIYTFTVQLYFIGAISWSPNSRYLAVGYDFGTVMIWDANTGKALQTLVEHKSYICALNWSPDSKYLGTVCWWEDAAIIWDVESGSVAFKLEDSNLGKGVYEISWSPNGRYISTTIACNTLAIWDVSTKKRLYSLQCKCGTNVSWSPDCSRIAAICLLGKARVWDAATGTEILTIDNITEDNCEINWNPDGTKLAITGIDNKGYIWDALTGKKLYTLTGHKDKVNTINWSPNGRMAATTSEDYTAKIWFVDRPLIELQADSSDAKFSIVAPSATANNIDMKKCIVGSAKDSLIQDFIKNTGILNVRIDSIYFSGSDADAFSLASDFPKYEIGSGEIQSTVINFRPKKIGMHIAAITIITQSETLDYLIQGEGVEQKIEMLSNILDFGPVELGKENTIADTALIKNISNQPVEITNVVQLGPDTKQFEIICGGGAFTLQPNESRKLTIRFKPTKVGRATGELGFEFNDVGSPAKVQLFGTGTGGIVVKINNDSAYAGETRNLKLVINDEKLEIVRAISPNFSAKIRFQKTILTPLKKADRNIVNDSIYMDIKGTIGTDQELAQIPVMAGLGLVTETSIDIVDFILMDESGNVVDFDIEKISGTFKLLGICQEGGTRLIYPSGKVEILQIVPNPASDDVEINVNLIEDGATTLSVFNSNGIKLKEFNMAGKTGLQTINLDIREFDNGLYFIKLQTPTVVENQKLMIIK